jgi:hypothetical protein
MKEYPIPFTGEMVRAILDGRKTMTRRTSGLDEINENPSAWGFVEMFEVGSELYAHFGHMEHSGIRTIRCPYGKPGDRLWVKETFSWVGNGHSLRDLEFLRSAETPKLVYRASVEQSDRWHPSLHMPRWASRITLEIVSVRIERLNDISEDDAFHEGCEPWTIEGPAGYELSYVEEFAQLWESINGKGSWSKNDWVWVIEFKKPEDPK